MDPNLEIPSAMLHTIPNGERRQNLQLDSTNGSISAEINLVGDGPGKAYLQAYSTNGSVRASIVSNLNYQRSYSQQLMAGVCPHQLGRQNKKFRIKISSNNGSVKLLIPRDFLGPITYTIGNGSIKFSPEIEKSLTIFSAQKKIGKAFLGDWASAGFGNEQTGEWEGDEIETGSTNGSVRVAYLDEEDTPIGSPLGWFSKLFGGASGSNPNRGSNIGYTTPTAENWNSGAATDYSSQRDSKGFGRVNP